MLQGKSAIPNREPPAQASKHDKSYPEARPWIATMRGMMNQSVGGAVRPLASFVRDRTAPFERKVEERSWCPAQTADTWHLEADWRQESTGDWEWRPRGRCATPHAPTWPSPVICSGRDNRVGSGRNVLVMNRSIAMPRHPAGGAPPMAHDPAIHPQSQLRCGLLHPWRTRERFPSLYPSGNAESMGNPAKINRIRLISGRY